MTTPTPLQAMQDVNAAILVATKSMGKLSNREVIALVSGMNFVQSEVTKLLEGVAVELEAHREYAGGDKADYWLGLQSGLNDAISIIRNTLQK